MNRERWEAMQRLFEEASGLPATERLDFLRRNCADESLREEVLGLFASRPPSQFLEPPPREETLEKRDLGDFLLLEEIGRGAMGVVYKAKQRSLGRFVAVKVLPANLTLTQRQIDRFRREAFAAGRLQHPGIAAVFTVGDEKGTHYFAMELVDGRNLAEELVRLRSDLGVSTERANLPSTHDSDYFRTVAEIVRQAADALAHAHQQGIVHRDIKPSNLLLDSGRRLKVVDFGLARDEEQGSLSTARDGVGTPHYMSPEQAHAATHTVDNRTDIYSLGVVLYELLTLTRPFEGTTSREVIERILRKEPPRIRKLNKRVPRDLETICMKAMARKPKSRFRTADELRDELARFLAHEAILTHPPTLAETVSRALFARRRPLGALAGTVLAALLAVSFALERRDRVERERLEAQIRLALDSGGIDSLPVPELLQLRSLADRFRKVRSENEVVAAESNDPLVRLEREMEILRKRIIEEGKGDLALAKDWRLPEGTREFHLLRGLRTLLEGSHLFPEDVELARSAAIESVFPTLSVQAKGPGGEDVPAIVSLRRINPLTSVVEDSVLLGPTPLAQAPVQPGYYRVVVVFESGGFRELICSPGPASSRIDLIARKRENEAAISEGMVRFDSGSYLFPDDAEGDWHLEGQTIALPGYYLDRHEVSNTEYHGFVSETGHEAPSYWHLVPDTEEFLARYGDRPVVGVSWEDAVAYAEWCGKRLPTAAEWMRAACGQENRALPYAAAQDGPVRGNVHHQLGSVMSETGWWQEYLSRSAPVDSHPEAATPDGLFHMFGNVIELTESMMVEVLESGVPVPRSYDRIGFGSNWSALARRQSMRAPEYFGTGRMYSSHYLGFRCAKSAEP